jgi:hypothetical protein
LDVSNISATVHNHYDSFRLLLGIYRARTKPVSPRANVCMFELWRGASQKDFEVELECADRVSATIS